MDLLKLNRAPVSQVGAVRLVLLPISFLSLFCALALLTSVIGMRGERQRQAEAGGAESEADFGPGNTPGPIEENTEVVFGPHECIIFASSKGAYPAFIQEVLRAAAHLHTNPNFLMAIMCLETGCTFSPSIPNQAGSGAVGLIQFMPRTAANLGTSTAQLARLSAAQQVFWVEKYFIAVGGCCGRIRSVEDAYCTTFYPRAITWPNSVNIFCHPQKGYTQNRGFDHDHDGCISKGEVTSTARARYDQGIRRCQHRSTATREVS